MIEKITITLQVNKISKSKILSRSFVNRDNEEISVKELKLDIVPLKEPKLLKDADTYQLWKTHFVAEQQTKEERDAKIKSNIIGEGVMFKNKETKIEEDIMPESNEVKHEDLPW